MIRRRDFGAKVISGVIGAEAAAATASAQTARGPRKNTLMHVGGDYLPQSSRGRHADKVFSGVQRRRACVGWRYGFRRHDSGRLK